MKKSLIILVMAVFFMASLSISHVLAGPLENSGEFNQEVAEGVEERNINESDQSTTSGLIQWDDSGDGSDSDDDKIYTYGGSEEQ